MLPSHDTSFVPTHWCNFVFDYPEYAERDLLSLPAILGDSKHQVNIVPQQPMSLAKQSINTTDPFIPIPAQLLVYYYQYRPTPLRRANQLERYLGVNARIYYKFEGANISGSDKLNTALAHAYYDKQPGIEHLDTGTGARHRGTAIPYACKMMNLQCSVFMVGASLKQKPLRGMIMELFGAKVYESPSEFTAVGRAGIERDPERLGTLAGATGEALEFAHNHKRTRFAVGSG